jgi:hypothetical protein
MKTREADKTAGWCGARFLGRKETVVTTVIDEDDAWGLTHGDQCLCRRFGALHCCFQAVWVNA